MSRILVFSPYAKRLHLTAYEGTIAKACQIRGATVEYILCDGLLPECDMHWDSFTYNHSRPFDLCQRCQIGAKSRLDDFGLNYKWLGELVSQQQRKDAFEWAQSLSTSAIPKAIFTTYPLGEWVLSSVISYFRQYPPDMSNWRVVNVYRGFIFAASIVTIGLQKYLKENLVDSSLLFNGRQSITRVAFEILQKNNVRVLTHEYPFYQDGHLMLKPNARCWSPTPFEEFWQKWGQIPLTKTSLNITMRWLVNRRYGKGFSWYAFNNPYLHSSSIKKKLNLSQNKRLFALFTSSTDETAGDQELEGPYDSQYMWVQDVVNWVKKRNDIQLIIRVHPHLAGKTGLGKAAYEYAYYEKLKAKSPENVRIVMPDDTLNSYALMDEAEIGLTYGSSVGIEMAMLGKPIILGSKAFYENGRNILTIRSREALPELMEKSLQSFSIRELRREAFRIAYYYVFKFELPFPLVSKMGVTELKLNYDVKDPKILELGQDDTLDHACNFLMEGQPLFDYPTEDDANRTMEEENAFFEILEGSSEPLRDLDYEKWLRFSSKCLTVKIKIQRLPFGFGYALNKIGKLIYMLLLHWLENRSIKR